MLDPAPRHPRPRSRRRPPSIAAILGVCVASLLATASVAAAATIEGTNSISAWTGTPATIDAGESVTFKNSSTSTPHGVAFDAPPATPDCAGVVGSPGQTNWEGSCTFAQAGEYDFHCTVHAGMIGEVKVNASGPGAPIVSTSAATAINDTAATLEGSVDPNGLATEYFFKYGETAGYGQETGKTSVPAGSPVTASTGVAGLSAATTYHFRLFAENTSGTSEGSDLTFTTTGPPLATTSTATQVSNTGATLRGSVNPRGHATTYFFKYGTTTAYGNETSVSSPLSGTSSTPVSAPLTGLSPETTYHFLLVANNSSGTDEGVDQMFTTTSTPADTTDPQTTIKVKPANPTNSSTVEFTYESNEPGSTFECSMDGESFTECPSTGKTYTGLAEGPHTFQVRATDPSLNTDESPASYTFSVALPATPPEVIPPKVDPPPTVDPPPAVAPNTTISLKPKAKTKDRTPTFKFKSTVSGATFECQLDGKAFKACRSPLTTKRLKPGRHSFKVRAVAGGLRDPSPAASSFKVIKKPK